MRLRKVIVNIASDSHSIIEQKNVDHQISNNCFRGLVCGRAWCLHFQINMNVSNAPIATGKSPEVNQVRQTVFATGITLGWRAADAVPGVRQGMLCLLDHTAVVEIPYVISNYSIVFTSGVNLSEEDGQIHKNYNGWV